MKVQVKAETFLKENSMNLWLIKILIYLLDAYSEAAALCQKSCLIIKRSRVWFTLSARLFPLLYSFKCRVSLISILYVAHHYKWCESFTNGYPGKGTASKSHKMCKIPGDKLCSIASIGAECSDHVYLKLEASKVFFTSLGIDKNISSSIAFISKWLN